MDKKYKFSVNTAEKCFLCFGEAVCKNYNSLGNILHCLKINLTELHSLSSKPPSLLNKTDFKIRLCSECGLIIQKFSKEYETLQVYKMKVASTLEIIKKRLTQVMPKVYFKEEGSKFFKHCKIVEELRSKMVKKCETKIDRVLPKVRIKKINLKDIEVKQKPATPSESAPLAPLEIKPEPFYDANNFEDGSFFNSDFQTEIVETEPPKIPPKPAKRKKQLKIEKHSLNRKVFKRKYCKRKVNQKAISTSEPIVALEIKPEPIYDNFDSILTDFQTETVPTPAENLNISGSEFNFYCEICGERFINRIALFSHEKTHKNPDELFYCFCGAGCCSEERLRIHQRRVHSDKNLPCSICSKTFPSKTLLRNHKKTHFEPRPFKCTFENCEMTYAKKDRLNHHMKVHSEEFPWKCQRCGKSFPFKAKLQRHSQIHKVQRSRINCNLCPASFLHRKNLIIHTRNAHGLPLGMIETSIENYVTNVNPSELFFDT